MNYKEFIIALQRTSAKPHSKIDKELIAFTKEQPNHIGIKVVNSLSYISINDQKRNCDAFRKFLSILFYSLDSNQTRRILEFTDPKRTLYNQCISYHICKKLPFSELQYFFKLVIEEAPETLPELCANPFFFNEINNKVDIGKLLYQLICSNHSLGGGFYDKMYGRKYKRVMCVDRSGKEFVRKIPVENDTSYQKAILEYIKTLSPQQQSYIIKHQIRKKTPLNFYMKLGKDKHQRKELGLIIKEMKELVKEQCKEQTKAQQEENKQPKLQLPGPRFFKNIFNNCRYQQLPMETDFRM